MSELEDLRAEVDKSHEDLRIEIGLHEEMTARWVAAEAKVEEWKAKCHEAEAEGDALASQLLETEAHLLRESVPDGHARAIVQMSEWMERAEAAEAKVAAVGALADEWTTLSCLPTPLTFVDLEKATPSDRLLWEMADDLRTLLSEQPIPGFEPEAKRWRLRVAAHEMRGYFPADPDERRRALREALEAMSDAEPAPEGDEPIDSVPVFRGWHGYADGSRSDVERWVRATNGDWVSLDSERRTDGDIILESWS